MIRNSKRWRPLLLLIILVAFGLRIHQLDKSGFWLDEALTPLRSGYSVTDILSNRIIIQEGVTKDTHPPLYYLVIHFGRLLLGESDFSYRFPSALAGLLLIPLLFQLARRMENLKTALLVALLAAINPLQIWYAQEARMYTLLVLLATAATLALWRAMTERHLFRWLALYIVLASLAFYTHYTAIFLIGAQGLFWSCLLWRQGHRRLLIGSAVLGLLVALPLLPFTIPRIFTGTEASYFYVSPLVMLQDVVHGFGLGRTIDWSQTSIKLLDLGVGLVLLAGLIAPRSGGKSRCLRRAFLLAFLFAAVVGLMLGSLIKPMYMGVRHIMVGSPAFLLLAALGLFSLDKLRRRFSSHRLFALLPLLGLTILLAGPLVSLNNLYHDPIYAKDDVRALIQYVDQHAGGNDLILYNDAIQLPLQWHYQGRHDLSAAALPTYPHPAGGDTLSQLQTLSEQFDRIWFIGHLPADKRDDGGLVRQWLADHLLAVDTFSAHGLNLEVKVTAYTTAPVLVRDLPAGGHPLDVTFDELPHLQGIRLDFKEPAALPALWLDLYWQGDAPAADRQLRFALRGPDQKIWLDHNHSFWPERAQPWPETGLVRLTYHLPVPVGIPPGEYELMLLAWDKTSGQTSGDWQTLLPIELAASNSWPLLPEWTLICARVGYTCADSTTLRFDNGIELLGLSAGAPARPGHPVPMTLFWQAESPPVDLQYQIEVLGPTGNILSTENRAPGADWLTADTWPLGTIVREQTGLYFPPETIPGRYQLRWSLKSGEKNIPGRPAWRPWRSESVTFGQIVVEPWPMETEFPAVPNLLRAQVGPSIELYGYELDTETLQPGDLLGLTLYWQALQVPDRSTYVFVHLVAAGDGTIISQLDRVPVDWLRPTSGWRPGEVLTDPYHLAVPKELAPGTYSLYVGMFDPDTWQRLSITYQGETQPDDRLLLTTLTHE